MLRMEVGGHGIGLELTPVLSKMASGDFTLEQRDAGTAGHLVFYIPDLRGGGGKPL